VTAFSFKPWYVGFTIGMWIAIIQLTIIIFIKYYQSYYQMSFTVQLSIILAFVIFAIWIIIMAIFAFVKLEGEERTKILVAFCIGSCAYLFSVILGMAWMKTNAIDKRDSLPVSIKVRFI
jgi:heme/copper-type cytochrome/quinol oxidase subunit 4